MTDPVAPVYYEHGPTVWQFCQSDAFVRILMGPRGEGKGLVHGTLVMTPSGMVKVEDLQAGDLLLAGDGTPTPLLGVYPQPIKPLYRLRFSDGTAAEVSDDHLWVVETSWDRQGGAAGDTRDRTGRGRGLRRAHRGQKVVTTGDIVEKLTAGAWAAGGRWSLPLVAPVQFPAQPVPFDPYVLGILLGDGGLTGDSVFLTTADTEILEAVRAGCPGVRVCPSDRYSYRLQTSGPRSALGHWPRNGVKRTLHGLGLMGHGSRTKFIPDLYLWNTPAVRLAVLQGLLDTDGTVSKHSNSVSFTSVSDRLVEGVEFLVRSLGGLTRRRRRQTFYRHRGERRPGQPAYHLSVRLPNGVRPFRLARKAAHVRAKGPRNQVRRFIVGAEPLGQGLSTCLAVAHPSQRFVLHDFIVTHNTVGGFQALLHGANKLGGSLLPLRVAVLRDTWTNLHRTTMTTLRELAAGGLAVTWLQDGTEAILGNGLVHCLFFGLDRAAEVVKLQGLGIGVLWIEEPAPALDVSGGIPAEVFGVGATSLRQPGVEGWVQITMNPPDADHWVLSVARRLRELAPHYRTLHRFPVQLFRIPKGENVFYAAARRVENRLALEATGRLDLIDRLVEGRVGQVQLGESVVPEYNDDLHVASEPLPILETEPLIRLYDFGLTPSVVWTQVMPSGAWHLLGAIQGVNVGIEQLIETQLKPWESAYCPTHPAGFRDIGDPSGRQREQSNSERTAALAVEARLHTTFEAGPVFWPERRDALRAVFSRLVRGHPMVVVDPEATLIRRALRGGWHYPKDGLGKITATVEAAKRASGLHDHIGHALSYGAATLYPLELYLRPPRRRAAREAPEPPRRRSWMSV